MGAIIPAASVMSPGWVDFLIMTGTFLLVAAGALIWIFFFRQHKRRRRKHRHHHHSHPGDVTPAPKDGRPAAGPEKKSSGPRPPTPRR